MTVTAKRKTAAVKNWLCPFSTFMLPAALEVPDLATSPEKVLPSEDHYQLQPNLGSG